MSALTPAWFKLRPHAQQSKLWRTTARFPVVVAGRQSGKTELARRRLVLMLQVRKPWSDPRYFLGFPTYGQAEYVAMEKISALIPQDWLVKDGFNKTKLTFKTVFGSTLYLVGMDRPQRIEGQQFDGGVLDEMSDQKPGGYTRTILPMLPERKGWCWRIGKPKRTGVGAKEFREAYEMGLKPNAIGVESYTWKSDTVQSAEELAIIAAQMGQEEYDEEVNASWLDAKGGVFYAYDDVLNVSDAATYNSDDIIGVGSDFNVDPMCWVLFHYRNSKMYVFDEVQLKDTNTQRTLDTLHSRYPAHHGGWSFFGDASSQNRHTSTSMTDYLQIYNDKRFGLIEDGSKRINYPKANPAISERFAACNALLCNAKKERRVFIHPRCKNLRADLMQRTYKEGTRELPANEGAIGHITDALGYPIHRLAPIRVESTDAGKVNISQ